MTETNLQKLSKHRKKGGFFYAVYRGVRYFKWRFMCMRMGIDWRRFSR